MLRYAAPRFADSYRNLMQDCLRLGDDVSPRGKATKELQDVFIDVDGACSPVGLAGRTAPLYLANEMAWYLSGTSDPARVAAHAKMWDNCRNPDGTVNSNYGVALFGENRLDFDPTSIDRSGGWGAEWDWCLRSLLGDPDTRQAIAVIHRPAHHWDGNKDLPCTLNIRFRIEHGGLVTRVHMRSCDLWWGLPYDAAWFQIVHRGMWHALNANGLNVGEGMVRIQLDSAHIYERHIPTAEALVALPIPQWPITKRHALGEVLIDMEALCATPKEVPA